MNIIFIVKYISFENGVVTLTMTIKYLKGKVLEKAANWLSHRFQEEIPRGIQLDYPIITADVNRLLTDRNINDYFLLAVFFLAGAFLAPGFLRAGSGGVFHG